MKYTFKFQILVAKKEKYVWLMEMPQQEEWKFVSVVSGVWCVITTGMSEMPGLLAETLDYHSNVSIIRCGVAMGCTSQQEERRKLHVL